MKHIQTIIFLSLFLQSSFVNAGSLVPGSGVATEMTQIRNEIQLIMQVAEQIKTYKKLVEQYKNMLENSSKWEELFWSEGIDSLLKLAEALDKDGVIAYSAEAILDAFEEQYPGYEEYLKIEAPEWTPEKQNEFYKKWRKSARNNITGALEAMKKHHEDFATEEEVIAALQVQASSPEGRNQALQTANEIAIEQLRQMQKLRQMIMTQVNLQANYMAANLDKEEVQSAHKHTLEKEALEEVDNYIIDNSRDGIIKW